MEDLLDAFPDTIPLTSQYYRSYVYQPERISISSDHDTVSEEQATISQGFSQFTVRLSRPCLKVKSLQLLRASIPTPVTNLPDYTTTFWYFALPKVSTPGLPPYAAPDSTNLRFIRLLPSFLPPELVGTKYGYNRTFTDYSDLVSELNKSCAYDPLYDVSGKLPLQFGETFVPNDISFTYNATYNKLQVTGANSNLYYLPAPYNSFLLASGQGDLEYSTRNTFGLQGDLGLGQPFKTGFTLNTRLGWTWNGTATNETNLKNLMRPVPPYNNTTRAPNGFLTSFTNTADSYANLVNTNNIYIYLTMLGSTSLDSAGRGALLAVIPINATNNAVGFYNNVLSNPLTKIPEFIQELQIQLRNDDGEDFVLPNSASVNFELGLSYT
jgi:hypothetical protein